MMIMRKLIIVEGLPCSGKSTASEYIAKKLDAEFFDEGTGNHPADYEFHAFFRDSELSDFSEEEQKLIESVSTRRLDGIVVPLKRVEGALFDRLLQHKIYDFLPLETESAVMLDKWKEFAGSVKPDEIYVFNCVLLQNPMCETMMRFGFDKQASTEYI